MMMEKEKNNKDKGEKGLEDGVKSKWGSPLEELSEKEDSPSKKKKERLRRIAEALGVKGDDYYSSVEKMGKPNDGMDEESSPAVGNSSGTR